MTPSHEAAADRTGVSVAAVPKAFRGQIGVIQDNALASWKLLPTTREILLLGGEDGVAEAAAKVGAVHHGVIRADGFGTPLLDDVFRVSENRARAEWICYVNADIILLPEFAEAVNRAREALGRCLVVSRRRNLKIEERLTFTDGWQQRLRAEADRGAKLFSSYGIDVFVFPKGLFEEVPAFSLGRSCWDNWLVTQARRNRYPVVDVTESLGVIHQDHEYDGFASIDEIRRSQQGLRNFWLAGDSLYGLSSTEDATHVLKDGRVVPSPTKTVTVVIPHASSLMQVRKCLRALCHQSYPRSYTEIVVVENSTHSMTDPISLEFPFVKLTREEKPGPAAARNKGAAIASGDLIAFLDSDCEPGGDWIKAAVAAAREHDFDCVVACNIKPRLAKSGVAAVQWYESVTFHEQKAYVERADACITGGILVPRSVWREVGPFDEDFPEAACEDWEWSTRASGRGIRIVYAPESVVNHPVHTTWRQLREKSRRLARGELRLAKKRGNEKLQEFRSLCAAYTRRLLRDVRVAMRDRRVPPRFRGRVALAATLVWLWSLKETSRALRSAKARRP